MLKLKTCLKGEEQLLILHHIKTNNVVWSIHFKSVLTYLSVPRFLRCQKVAGWTSRIKELQCVLVILLNLLIEMKSKCSTKPPHHLLFYPLCSGESLEFHLFVTHLDWCQGRCKCCQLSGFMWSKKKTFRVKQTQMTKVLNYTTKRMRNYANNGGINDCRQLKKRSYVILSIQESTE